MPRPKNSKGMLAIGHILVDTIGEVDTFPEKFRPNESPVSHVDTEQMAEILASVGILNKNGKARTSRSLGGGAAVTAMVASTLGLCASFKGSVGMDPDGEFLRQKLEDAKVDFSPQFSNRHTGNFLSLVDSRKRKIIRVDPAAARDVRGSKIRDIDFDGKSILYIDGLLIDSIEWLSDIVTRAKAKGMAIAMDYSTPGNAKINAAELRRFTRDFCDMVFANALETRAVYGTGDDAGIAGDKLIFIEKRGAEGAVLRHGGVCVHMKAPSGFLREDTCAGDALAAGFIKAWTDGLRLEECLSAGMASAAVAIQFEGSAFDAALMRAAARKVLG